MKGGSQLDKPVLTADYTAVFGSKLLHLRASVLIKIALRQIGRVEIDHPLSRSSEMKRDESISRRGILAKPFTNGRSAKDLPVSTSKNGIILATGCFLSSTTIPLQRAALRTQSPVFI